MNPRYRKRLRRRREKKRKGMEDFAQLSENELNCLNKRIRKYIDDIQTNIIKIDNEEEEYFKSIVEGVVNGLLDLMQQDQAFSELYDHRYNTGSFYEKLQVREATEFDINLAFDLPYEKEQRQIAFRKGAPGYCTYCLNDNGLEDLESDHTQTGQVLDNLFSDHGYLDPSNFIDWFQKHLERAINVMRTWRSFGHEHVLKVTQREGGPARTIVITTRQNEKVFVDLVPVLRVDIQDWPNNFPKNDIIFANFDATIKEDDCYYLVPKNFKEPYVFDKDPPFPLWNECFYENAYDGPNVEIRSFLWRLSLPEVERFWLHDMLCAKPVIRLLKLSRDNENWQSISSYALKTLVLWEIVEHPDREYWSNGKTGILFLSMLNKLAKSLAWGGIPNFLDKRHNLYHGPPEERHKIYRFIYNMLKHVIESPEAIEEYFYDDSENESPGTRSFYSSGDD